MNRVFHMSPSWILTKWYALHRSSLVKRVTPCKCAKGLIAFHCPGTKGVTGRSDDPGSKGVIDIFLHGLPLRAGKVVQLA